MAATFIGGGATTQSGGTNTLTVPVGTQAGDLIVVHALGRSSNMPVPANFNFLQLGTGSGETSFTTATVSWGICPSPVPATITAGSASNNSHASIVVYRAGAGETFFFDGQVAGNAANGANITPSNITTTRAVTVLMCPASNSANNGEIVNFGGAYTARANVVTGNRIATAILETTVGAGTSSLPTVTLDRTEVRGYFAFSFYTAVATGAWSFAGATHATSEGVAGAVDDKIYLLGGLIGTSTNRMYDPDLDTITSKATLVNGTDSTSSGCAFDGWVYHFKSGALYGYEVASNTWEVLSTPPFTVTTSWIAPDGLGYLWAAGGSGAGGGTTPLMKYAVATATWTTPGGTVNNNYGKRAALGADGMIYSFGGQFSGVQATAVQKLNPVTGVVTSSTVLPAARSIGQVGVSDPLIFYSAGWNASFVVINTHWAFDTETATWSTKSPVSIGTNSSSSASIGRRFYVVGGYDESDNTVSAIQIWHDPEVNGGVLASTGVARTSLYAEGRGDITAVATSTSGEGEVSFSQSVQADSFLDMGSTGQPPD